MSSRPGVDRRTPWRRDLETVPQLAAGDTEQVGDRAGVPEGDQHCVDPVFEHRAVLHQMQPEPSQLALAPDRRVGQPDLGDQVSWESTEDASVDLVGLAGQRPQALDLGRIGDRTTQPSSSSASCTKRAPLINSITPRTGTPL
jgi:hypothetical protein